MPRHSFIRMTKLTDVRGRVDYISNPKRQEHLYATYSTVKPEFWEYLSEQAQHEFWKSNQKSGRCIEGRELIIALPESLKEKDPELILKLFTETFRLQYGVHCSAAMHHNKTMTNYHIHLVFADRDHLEKTEVKKASRRMFYNEERRHVRTKKEILDADGNVRVGCRIIEKGETYDIRWFSARKDVFKDRRFIDDVKVMYTDLINNLVEKENEKLQIFDASGPYLPTRKIGKNNPKEAEIRMDNQLRQEWNHTVDQVLIAGGQAEEVTQFKREEVVSKVADSVREHGHQPGLFAEIIKKAIAVLKEFLEILMKNPEEQEKDNETVSVENSLAAQGSMRRKKDDEGNARQKGERPNSYKEQMRCLRIEPIHRKLVKCNRKLYALQKQKKTVQLALDNMPHSIFNKKDRKELQTRIDDLQRQIELCRNQLETIPKMNGFGSVRDAEKEYREAKEALEKVRKAQSEWDGAPEAGNRGEAQPQKISILKQLAEMREQQTLQGDVHRTREKLKGNRKETEL